jgi:hypothetical protein
MDMHPVAMLVETDNEDDFKSTVQIMRRVLEGTQLSSVVIQKLTTQDADDVQKLRQQVDELQAAKLTLESTVQTLQTQLSEVNQQPFCGPAVNGFYTMEQFLSVLTAKLRRSYGWRTDYIGATHETGSGGLIKPVPNEEVQKWQNTNQVPDWAVEQIARLTFRKRGGVSGKKWSDDDELYLMSLYNQDPLQRNQLLAEMCERHFGRSINESAIKGALDRIRRRGKLPLKRPSRIN